MTSERIPAAARRLREALGPAGLVADESAIAQMSTPWRDRFRSRPALVVQPATTAEVQAVVRICGDALLPVVAQGGNTGMTGAGLARDGGTDVLLSLRRLNRIRALDLDDDMIVVDAGCVLSVVKDAARSAHRLFPLSLGAEGSCTVGGNIATNAGGINALRYGPMRNLVAGLEVVLPDGSVWDGLRSLRKDNAGYDLKHLFIGSEGTLGIVTAAALKLAALPATTASLMVAVDGPAAALAWFRRLRQRFGEQIAACELIERICIDIARRHLPDAVDPLPDAHPWYVLAEVSAQDDDAGLHDRLTDAFAGAYDSGEVRDGVVAASQAQAAALWRMRESLAEAHKREGVSFKHDISVPTSKVPAFIAAADRTLGQRFPGIRPFSFGHLGDGNIHYNPLQAAGEAADLWHPRLAEINRIVHDAAIALGGSITAEHGIGQLRRDELVRYKSAVELQTMRTIKRALDPRGLFNPGKLFIDPPSQA